MWNDRDPGRDADLEARYREHKPHDTHLGLGPAIAVLIIGFILVAVVVRIALWLT